MSKSFVALVTTFLLPMSGINCLAAQTLQETLRVADVPTEQFSGSELSEKITSYAVSGSDPFLLAYFVDHGSGLLEPPLHVIRYDRATGALNRADLGDIKALSQGAAPEDCDSVGSALRVREYHGLIYIDTHTNPSAGCLIVLSSTLSFKAVLSGTLRASIGADFVILERSEVHFMSVHPLHIEVFDVQRSQSTELYPFNGDPQRRAYARSIKPYISEKWCVEHNAQCDPENFDVEISGDVIVNEAAKAFAFQAQFDAGGFGDTAEKHVLPRTVVYFFRERNGGWEHREFSERDRQLLRGGMSIDELINTKPDLPFQSAHVK